MRFDYRWIVLIVAFVVLANASVLPWPLIAALLAGGGGYLLFYGWRIWNSGLTNRRGPKVQYWRGARYEVQSSSRRSALPPLREIQPALIFLLIGLCLVLAAIALVMERLT